MTTITRAKFTCTSVTKKVGWGGHPFVFDFEFAPVTRDSARGQVFKDAEALNKAQAENEQFFAATPGGRVNLVCVASDHFQVGKDYYLDLQPA